MCTILDIMNYEVSSCEYYQNISIGENFSFVLKTSTADNVSQTEIKFGKIWTSQMRGAVANARDKGTTAGWIKRI